MRLHYLTPLIILFGACVQKKPEIHRFQTKQFVLIDTDAASNQFSYMQTDIDFPIYYIGPVKDTICIGRKYGIGRTQVSGFPLRLPVSRDYSAGKISVTVDTSFELNGHFSHFFIIKNISDSVIWMGRTFSVFFLHLEMKNKAGHWVKIGKKLSELGICGTGQPSIFLGPGEVMISKVSCNRGAYPTQARLVFGYGNRQVYSNSFEESVDDAAYLIPPIRQSPRPQQ